MLHITAAQFIDSSITAVSIFGLGYIVNGLVQSAISAWKSAGRPVATIAPVTATPASVEAWSEVEAETEAFMQVAPAAPTVEVTPDLWETPQEYECVPLEVIAAPVAPQLLIAAAPLVVDAAPVIPVAKTSKKVAPKTPKAKAVKAPKTSKTDTSLAAMASGDLRKLCTARDIKWRNALGTNKHLGKAAMLLALAS